MSATNDGSESVDAFLARIASVKGGRDEADEARSKKTEEELLRAKKERQARRAERARSLSPSKTGPAAAFTTAPQAGSISPEKVLSPPVDFKPRAAGLARSNAVKVSPTLPPAEFPAQLPPSPTRLDSTEDAHRSASGPGLARSGTLSWQQRPTSKDGSPTRARPLSGFASVRTRARDSTPDAEAQNAEPSRKDIAAALGAKDPTWFRQTQDRGLSSAAYRKNQVEGAPPVMSGQSMQLPGMLKETTRSSRSPTPDAVGRASRQSSEVPADVDRFRRGVTPDMAALRNSITSPAASRSSFIDSADSSAPTPELPPTPTTLGRTGSILGSRPISPTKGLGGFVESAMMRRSDSVSKRWSVQATSTLKRGDSTAAMRPPSVIGTSHDRSKSRDMSMQRNGLPSSPLASSRPTSSHGPLATDGNDMFRTSISDRPLDLKLMDLPTKSSKPVSENVERPKTPPTEEVEVSRSPSKATDTRRWSPTKSTWLESALQAKNEPVKMQPMKEEQPKWKLDLQRSKSKNGRDATQRGTTESISLTTSSETTKPSSASTSTLSRGQPTVPKDVNEKPVISPKLAKYASEAKLEEKEATAPTTEISSSRPDQKCTDSDSVKDIKSTKEKPEEKPEVKKDGSRPPVSDAPALLATRSPPPLKAKPQAAPTLDFRATLKSRPTGSSLDTSSEPEFKAMFGKLKRTTTQNYVAPDELKNNILTGKAALNLTDGPQKTRRVDEFKESILAKKEEMKIMPKKQETVEKMDAPVPEALARRKTLSKASRPAVDGLLQGSTKTIRDEPRLTPTDQGIKPGTASTRPTIAPKPNMEFRDTVLKGPTAPEAQMPLEKSTAVISNAPKRATSAVLTDSKALQQTTDLKSSVTATKPSVQEQPLLVKHSQATSPAKSPGPVSLAGLPAGSKLASRLNPSLAALISRGSSPRPAAGQQSPPDDTPAFSGQASVPREESNSGPLNHMTKGRAKGPKRRAPKSEAPKIETPKQPAVVASPQSQRVRSPPLSSATPQAPKSLDIVKAATRATNGSVTLKNAAIALEENKDQGSNTAVPDNASRPKPVIPSKSPEVSRVSSLQSLRTVSKEGSPASTKPAASPKPRLPFPAATRELQMKPASPQTPPKSVSLDSWGSPAAKTSSGQKPALNDKSISPRQESEVNRSARGLGLSAGLAVSSKKPSLASRELTPPTETDIAANLGMDSNKLSAALIKCFGCLPQSDDKADFDTQAFLATRKSETPKTKTLQHTVAQISGDGKKLPVPVQQEHILYDENMYLITHNLEDAAGIKSAEVFLWCGNQIPEAAIEDVQIFCRRDAREHNAKLEVVRHGKESASFFQALGGIVIVRRSRSSTSYMLCARRHLNHIAFDEVDFSAESLCPGFAFIVVASSSKAYLWKGKGAEPEEVGCARLVGMDLGLTAELEEVSQGSESAGFWDDVNGKAMAPWADYWTTRTDHKGFPCSLLRVEHEKPRTTGFWGLKRAASPEKGSTKATLTVIEPYSQQDLDRPDIHILDAYHSMFVLVDSRCDAKTNEFITAINLAQEMAMLSPSIQDRALLPSCFVVFGPPPADVQACFRNWQSSQNHADSTCVRLEEVMEVLKL